MTPSIADLLVTSTDSIFDVIRFFASDKMSKSINRIIDSRSTPFDYATNITKQDKVKIQSVFATEYVKNYNSLPKDIKDAWVYDFVVEIASMVRITHVRPTHLNDAISLSFAAVPYLLTLNNTRSPSVNYGGLVEFKTNVTGLTKEIGLRSDLTNRGLINRLANAVGNIDDPTWIFHRPLWYKIFSDKPERLRVLRGFLYVAIVSHTSREDNSARMFNIKRDEVMDDVDYFISLLEDEETTRHEIITFLGNVEYYVYEIPKHTLLYSLYEGSFHEFALEHKESFGTIFNAPPQAKITDKVDTPYWQTLRSLGKEFEPEVIIETDLTPFEYLESLKDNHLDVMYQAFFKTELTTNDGHLTESYLELNDWWKATIKDKLFMSLIFRRLMSIYEDDAESSSLEVRQNQHILLVFENFNIQTLGLSIIGTSLNHHIANQKETLPEKELLILQRLSQIWGAINFTNPSTMNETISQFFQDDQNRQKLRSFFFVVIEGLNIPVQLRYDTYLSVSRENFFGYIEKLCDHFTGDHSAEEISTFLDKMPMLGKTWVLTEWQQLVWSAPFRMIPQIENEEDDSIALTS